MAFALGFPRDATALIESLWDWRYRLVRGGGKTPSASAMPLPVHGKYYFQRIYMGDQAACEFVALAKEHFPDSALAQSCSFGRCSSKDVRPCDLAALWSTCDACEPVELELQRTHV